MKKIILAFALMMPFSTVNCGVVDTTKQSVKDLSKVATIVALTLLCVDYFSNEGEHTKELATKTNNMILKFVDKIKDGTLVEETKVAIEELKTKVIA